MATTYDIQQLLVKEAGRIGPEIYRRTIDTSAWLKLTKQEQFPEEMGDVISSVTFERYYPSLTIATATSAVTGYNSGEITADAGSGWRKLGSNPVDQTYQGFNPFDQTLSGGSTPPVSSTSTAGNVLPAQLSGVTFGQKLRQYSLEWASIDSPDIALEDLRFAVKRKEQLSNIMDVLTESTSLIWQDRYRNLFTKQVADAGNLVYPASASIVASTSGAAAANDLTAVYNAAISGIATAFASGAITASSLPQSQLTQGILKRLYMKLVRDGAGSKAMGRENGAPVFMLICGAETSESLIRLNADIRQDFRYAKPNELLTPLGIDRSYGGFYHSIDAYPPRFRIFDVTAGAYKDTLIRTYPFIKSATTKGTSYDINPAYETADYEISYIFHQDVMRSVVPSPINTANKMGFNPQNYRGEFKWVNILDRQANPDGNVGYFRGVCASGARPVFPQYGYAIMHKRSSISLDYVS
jgi:hypothetical protein